MEFDQHRLAPRFDPSTVEEEEEEKEEEKEEDVAARCLG